MFCGSIWPAAASSSTKAACDWQAAPRLLAFSQGNQELTVAARFNILLAEDEPQVARLMRMALERSDYEVTCANNGREALGALAEKSFALLITDLVMPDTDGIEAIVEIRERYPDLPILAVSGAGTGNAENYLAVARHLGADSTLAKPFAISELVDRVLALLPETGSHAVH